MPDFTRAARFVLFSLLTVSSTAAFAAGPSVLRNARHDTSLPLTQLAGRGRMPSKQPDREMAEPRATRAALASGRADEVAKTLTSPLDGVSTIINFDGQSANDNRRVFGFAFVPPDTNGAVGASQYVQMVNVTLAVYSKRDGTLQLGPLPIHSLWNGFGGLCENGGETDVYSDGGDPIVLYDHLADRWLVSQLQFDETFTKTAQCVAISTSSDATGSYNRYEFDFGVNFPDYPKFGIWPDVYYNSINVFPGKSFAVRRRAHSTGPRCWRDERRRRSASSSRHRCRVCCRRTWMARRRLRPALRITSSASQTRRTSTCSGFTPTSPIRRRRHSVVRCRLASPPSTRSVHARPRHRAFPSRSPARKSTASPTASCSVSRTATSATTRLWS